MRTLEQWEQLARGTTRGYSDEQIKAIAQICYTETSLGRKMSVWHAASIVGGHKCVCNDPYCIMARA